MEEFKFKVGEGVKERLDKFLAGKFSNLKPEITRSKIQNLIKENNVFDHKDMPITNISHTVKNGEEFLVKIPPAQPLHLEAKEIPFEIIFEDENLMVINKPAGLTVHPGGGNQDHTLVNALLFSHQNNLSAVNGDFRPGIVHRLDKDTSGLMVVAKNDLAHLELAKQIQNRTLKRNYLAFCFGVPKPLQGTIEKNIGRSKINRLKMAIMKIGGKSAITHYSVAEIYQNSLFSLVECRLETGRTHQIRLHLSSIGHSLIGDQTYGNRKKSLPNVSAKLRKFVSEFPRQALHSYKISFLHPISKEELEFETDLPEDLQELQDILSS